MFCKKWVARGDRLTPSSTKYTRVLCTEHSSRLVLNRVQHHWVSEKPNSTIVDQCRSDHSGCRDRIVFFVAGKFFTKMTWWHIVFRPRGGLRVYVVVFVTWPGKFVVLPNTSHITEIHAAPKTYESRRDRKSAHRHRSSFKTGVRRHWNGRRT